MVEEFEFTGTNIPTFSEMMRAIVNRELPNVEYIPEPPRHEWISRLIAFNGPDGKSYLVMHATIKFDRGMHPEVINDKIAFFSRFGCNFSAVGILEAACDKYGCGYMSHADGVLREPKA